MKLFFKIFIITLLLNPLRICAQEFIISEGSTWKYLDDGSNQEASWYLLNYDDTSWSEGVSEFGYGDNDESTVVSFGSDASNKHITTYFRKSFNIENPDVYNDLTLEAIRDDGIAVYLNGNKVWQDNLYLGLLIWIDDSTNLTDHAPLTIHR